MRTPFRLRRVAPEPAAALLVSGAVADLLAVCARLGERFPAIHAVEDGFLVRLAQPSEEPIPGAIRLRALSANLFVPADAELTPALLADEVSALVKQRGLVFLPGDRVLAFAPDATLKPADLLTAPRLPRRRWEPIPPAPDRPDELVEVILDIPDLPLEVFLDEVAGDIGSEAPELPQTGAANEMTQRLKANLGRSLHWLGDKLNWETLKKLGGDMVEQAMRQAPRVSEQLVGKQEAALRELLRNFREGNVADALKRALPLAGQPGRGGTIATSADLPTHSWGYRLSDYLCFGGGASLWVGGGSVYHELQQEYRKAAEDAAHRGDYLRAAVIYGKLLQDWPNMAAMLSRAGKHHDAALVYLQRLTDPMQAAREFEAAGEFDRALELYRQRGEYTAAGDLLRRIGEEELAVAEYVKAAEHEANHKNFLQAGRLLVTRARRPDLAEAYLTLGWQSRLGAEATNCLMELVDLHGGQGAVGRLCALLGEAEEHFETPGDDHAAGLFYNRVAQIAERESFAGVRDDLRDRALLGLAGKLRQRGREGDRGAAVLSMLFGATSTWEPALVCDAEAALRGQGGGQPRQAGRRMRTHRGRVTAASAAWVSGDLFVGFDDGALVHLRPATGEVTISRADERIVFGLSCNADGSCAVVLRHHEDEVFTLAGHQPGEVRPAHGPRLSCGRIPYLTPIAHTQRVEALGIWLDTELRTIAGRPLQMRAPVLAGTDYRAAYLVDFREDDKAAVVLVEGNEVVCASNHDVPPGEWKRRQFTMPWEVPEPGASGLPVLAWQQQTLTTAAVAGVDTGGALCWAALKLFTNDSGVRLASRTRDGGPYRLAALVSPGIVAGVHAGGVRWYRCGQTLTLQGQTKVSLADAVACFASPPTRELLVVCGDGDVVRVPLPG